MSKAWKIIAIIAAIALVLGGLCIGAGLITGGSFGRIFDQLTKTYGLENLRTSIEQLLHDILGIQPMA